MSLFQLSSNELATELNIHSSLVSKWKNNKRPLSGKGNYVAQIVEYFMKQDESDHYPRIKAIFTDAFPDDTFLSQNEISKNLSLWLTENEKERPTTAFGSIELGHILAHAVFDIYKGSGGKADCITRLLETALTMPDPQNLMIWDSQRMHAILDRDDMVSNPADLYNKLIDKGGTITKIHTLNGKSPEILFSVLEMLPLYATGKAFGYLENNYSEPPVKFAIYLLENTAAVVSVEFFDNKNTTLSYFISDPTTLSGLSQLYKTILQNCEPLCDNKFAELGEGSFFTYQQDMLFRKGIVYVLRAQILPLYTMSKKLFTRLLEMNNTPSDKMAEKIRMHVTLHNAFLRFITQTDFRILILLPESPEDFLKEPHFVKFSDGPLHVSGDIFLEHLREVNKLCKKNPRLKIFSTNNLFLPTWRDTNIIIKENSVILVTSTERFSGTRIRITDPVILNAFFAYLSREWYTIPPVKEYNNLLKIFSPFIEQLNTQDAADAIY